MDVDNQSEPFVQKTELCQRCFQCDQN